MRCPSARSSVVLAAVLMVLVSLESEPARAQPSPQAKAPVDSDQQALNAQAAKRFADKDYPGAIAIWENLLTSLGEARGYRIFYSLGLAFEAMGDVTRAIQRYESFLGNVPSGEADKLSAHVDDAKARVAKLKSSHGELRVRASDHVVLVRVGQSEPRPAGFSVWLSPGNHVIEMGVGTVESHKVEVTIRAGQAEEIAAAPDPKPSIAPPPSSSAQPTSPKPADSAPKVVPPKKEGSFPTALVILGVAATAGSFALPIVLHSSASKKSTAALALGTSAKEYPDAVSSYNSARTAYYISYALPSALGALTTTLIVASLVKKPPAQVAITIDTEKKGLWVAGTF